MVSQNLLTLLSMNKNENVRERRLGKKSDIWIHFTFNVKEKKEK